jgi:hypothetical protein
MYRGAHIAHLAADPETVGTKFVVRQWLIMLGRIARRDVALGAKQHPPCPAGARGDQYLVPPPLLDAPLALSCLIRCSSMLEELVEPL